RRTDRHGSVAARRAPASQDAVWHTGARSDQRSGSSGSVISSRVVGLLSPGALGKPRRSFRGLARRMTAKPRPAIVQILWAITLFLVLIGVAIVVRRTLQLFASSPAPSGFPGSAAMDESFARYRLLTMIHIIPGLFFVVLAPFQFVRGLRSRRPRLHRWMGRVVLVSGI